jgi:hypothetical protein
MNDLPKASEIKANAERFVSNISSGFGDSVSDILDFSPESLKFIEKILKGWCEKGSDPSTTILFAVGCYVGETIVRDIGGIWVDSEDGAPVISLEGVNGPIVINPIDKVFKAYDGKDFKSVSMLHVVALQVKKGEFPT